MGACSLLQEEKSLTVHRAPASLCLSLPVPHAWQHPRGQADLQAQGPQLRHLLLQGCLHVRHLSLQGESWWIPSGHVLQGEPKLWELLATLQACGCTCSCAGCCTGPCTWEHAAQGCRTVPASCSTHIAAGQVGLVPAQELLLHLQLGTALCLQPTSVAMSQPGKQCASKQCTTRLCPSAK